MVYHELGRYPLLIIRKLRIMKYWIKVKNSENCILQSCYEDMLVNKDKWLMNIKDELFRIGLGYLWDLDNVDLSLFRIIKSRIYDIYKQECLNQIKDSSKGYLYQYVCNDFNLQSYLRKPINSNYIKELTKIRLAAHNLNIESGRYTNVDREERICTLCELNDIEDEFHFILKCPLYHELRNKYIKPYYQKKPSSMKLVQLLSTENTKDLANLGKFVSLAQKKRRETL